MFAEAEFSLGSAHAKALDCIRKGGMGNGGTEGLDDALEAHS